MDIDKKIEELRKEFNEKIEELKREYKKEKNGKWIPQLGEDFYYLSSGLCTSFQNIEADRKILKYSKIFKTKEDAQEYADYLKAKKESLHFCKLSQIRLDRIAFIVAPDLLYRRPDSFLPCWFPDNRKNQGILC